MGSQNRIILITTCFGKQKEFVIDIFPDMTRNILFKFLETEDAEILNDCADYIICIDNIDDEDDENEKDKFIKKGEKRILNVADHPYPAMEYRIRLIKKDTNESKLFLYKICHQTATNDTQYKTMVSAIANYDENFLYEKDPKYLTGKRVYNSGFRHFHSLIEFLNKQKSLINSSLNSILDNPVLKDYRIVVETPLEKKQSVRSIIKNSRRINRDIVYSSKVVQSSELPINQYLLHMFMFSKIRLKQLKEECLVELAKVKDRIKTINENSGLNKKEHTIYQLGVYDKRKKRLEDFFETSNSFAMRIDRITQSNSFNKLKPSSKREKTIVYHKDYLFVERHLFLPLFQGYLFSFVNSYTSILSAPIKQTSKLFEAYCLLSLDSAIQEMGFNDLNEEIDYDHVIKRFIKDDYEFEIMYEINAKDVSIVQKNEVYYINDSRNVSPDFCLILKHKELPICFLVFDAKCRRIEDVHKSIVEKGYEKTIRNYLSFRYSTDDNPFFIPKIVDSFWFFVPDNPNSTNHDPINQLEYRFVKLALDGNESDFVSQFVDYISMYLD